MRKSKRPKSYAIKIKHAKLKRENAWGFCYKGDNIIEVDPRHKEKYHLGVVIHEAYHEIFPELPEYKVLKAERRMRDTLWEYGYRRIYL